VSKSDQPSPHESLAFASELIEARNALGLTQSQLSEQSRVSLSAIKGYETGRNVPGTRELRELCKTLRVTPNKLLFGVESPFTTFTSEDAANAPSDKGFDVQRGRIALLVNLLSVDECSAIYTLAHSIAVARHGAQIVGSHLTAADFITSLMRLNHRKGIEIDLMPKNRDFLLELAYALRFSLEQEEINGESPDPRMDVEEIIRMVSKK
jgi:transcriptional regulator with XRE-family HTH domain